MNAEFDITNIRFETPRLILREWNINDIQDMFDYASVIGVGEMAGWKHHESIEETRQIVELFIKEKKTFAIEYKQNHKVIGSIGVERYGAEDRLTDFINLKGREIGFVLSKDYWGQGIMLEGVNAVIDYLFNTLNLDFLLCGHFNFNKQSKRLQEKLGFKPYKNLIFDTRIGTKEPGVLNLLINPKKNIFIKTIEK